MPVRSAYAKYFPSGEMHADVTGRSGGFAVSCVSIGWRGDPLGARRVETIHHPPSAPASKAAPTTVRASFRRTCRVPNALAPSCRGGVLCSPLEETPAINRYPLFGIV